MCTCTIMFSNGDMSPRIWKCSEHGKTGMIGTMSIIDKIAPTLKIRKDEAWDKAEEFLNFKKSEAEQNHSIYFCEDDFNSDLRKKFNI